MDEKILIVDDDPDTIKFIEILLKRSGYQITSAINGRDALETAHREHPDLVILDVMMAGLDGFEVARSLRRHPETATTPILMFTAKSQVEDKMAGYQAGVDIYLTKPIHPVDLQANVKALLLQKKARADLLAKKGYVIGILAAKGGLGASTVALNLAISYHQVQQEGKTIVAELKPGQGSLVYDLGLTNPTGLVSLLRRNVTEINPQAVSEQLVPTTYGVHLLLASTSVHDIELAYATAQFDTIIQQLAVIAPVVVLDIGTSYMPGLEEIISLCYEIVLITEPTPNTVKRTQFLASELREKGFGSSRALTIILVNRTRSDVILSASQVEQLLGQSVTLGFPPAAEQAYRAAERSLPLINIQPEGTIATQFNLLAKQIAQHISMK